MRPRPASASQHTRRHTRCPSRRNLPRNRGCPPTEPSRESMLAILSTSALALRHGPMLATRAASPRARSSSASTFMIALDPLLAPTTPSDGVEEALQAIAPTLLMSGMNGKAMRVTKADIPTKAQVRKAVPKHCFERDTAKSLMYAAISVAQSAACVAVGALIPLKAVWAPVWLAYAAFTGTVWTGMLVVAHECGHGAFSDNRDIQDAVGTAACHSGPAPHPTLRPGTSTPSAPPSLPTALLLCSHARFCTQGTRCTRCCSCPTSHGSARTPCTTSTPTTSPRERRTSLCLLRVDSGILAPCCSASLPLRPLALALCRLRVRFAILGSAA